LMDYVLDCLKSKNVGPYYHQAWVNAHIVPAYIFGFISAFT